MTVFQGNIHGGVTVFLQEAVDGQEPVVLVHRNHLDLMMCDLTTRQARKLALELLNEADRLENKHG